MNCFQHPSLPALGICRSCGKGLCHTCLVELENGIACRNACEERVLLLNRIVDTNGRNMAVANRQVRSGGILVFCLGLCFCLLAALMFVDHRNSVMTIFIGTPGVLFTIFGLSRILSKGYAVSSVPASREESTADSFRH